MRSCLRKPLNTLTSLFLLPLLHLEVAGEAKHGAQLSTSKEKAANPCGQTFPKWELCRMVSDVPHRLARFSALHRSHDDTDGSPLQRARKPNREGVDHSNFSSFGKEGPRLSQSCDVLLKNGPPAYTSPLALRASQIHTHVQLLPLPGQSHGFPLWLFSLSLPVKYTQSLPTYKVISVNNTRATITCRLSGNQQLARYVNTS